MKRILFLISIISLMLIFSGCAGVSEMKDEVAMLKRDTDQMKLQMKDVITRLNEIIRRLENDIYPIAKGQSNQIVRIEKLESELKIANDKLDQNSYRISQMMQHIDDLNYRIKATPSSSYQSPVQSSPGSALSSSKKYSSLSPNQIYQAAYSDYLKGNYDLAIQGFGEYLTRYSNSELAGTVQYWLGECYYAKGEYQQAIAEFDKVIINYENDEKVRSAALKKGFALFELNQTAQGVIIMQQIIREFPNSRQSRIAKEKLESLGLKP